MFSGVRAGRLGLGFLCAAVLGLSVRVQAQEMGPIAFEFTFQYVRSGGAGAGLQELVIVSTNDQTDMYKLAKELPGAREKGEVYIIQPDAAKKVVQVLEKYKFSTWKGGPAGGDAPFCSCVLQNGKFKQEVAYTEDGSAADLKKMQEMAAEIAKIGRASGQKRGNLPIRIGPGY